MAHREQRVESRFYLRPDEHEHIKQVAKEHGVSMSELVRLTVLKKYPMPKKKSQKTAPNQPKSEPAQTDDKTGSPDESQSADHTTGAELPKEDLLYIILQEEKIIHRLITNSTKSILDSK